MLAMKSEHPDLDKFIVAKNNTDKLTHANLSVMVSDDFMRAILNDEEYKQSFVRETGAALGKKVKAKELFDKLVENNWNYAEPGILYWDRVKSWSLVSEDPDFVLEGINPCGELPLPAYGACNLGSFNLAAYLYYDTDYSYNWAFDFVEFAHDVHKVVRAMNDVLDEGLPKHPLEKQREVVKKWRMIGVGVMGFSDVLIRTGIKYGSPESLNLAEQIAKTLLDQAVVASAQLAKEYGPYPGYNHEAVLASPFFNQLSPRAQNQIKLYGLRNATLLSIAPTGTISTMIGVSGGIEPIFAKSYERRTESLHSSSVSYKVFTPVIARFMDEYQIEDEDDLPDYIVTAADITPENRVLMQATWQKYIDSSISSTVNLPESATLEDIRRIYIFAWMKNLKGITVYRAGCAREGILTAGENVQPSSNNVHKNTSSKEKSKAVEAGIYGLPVLASENLVSETGLVKPRLERGEWKSIAEDTEYKKIKLNTGCGKLVILPGWSESEQKFQEIWVKKRGKGGCSCSIDAIVIEMSGILRLGGSLDNVAQAFDGIEVCKSFDKARSIPGRKVSKGSSCADAILKALQDLEVRLKSKSAERLNAEYVEEVINDRFYKNKCPECGESLNHAGGCIVCPQCGWTKCD